MIFLKFCNLRSFDIECKYIGMSLIFKVRLAYLPTRVSFLLVRRVSGVIINQRVNWVATMWFAHSRGLQSTTEQVNIKKLEYSR